MTTDRDESRSLLTLAGSIQREADEIGVGRTRQSPVSVSDGLSPQSVRFDEAVTYESLRSASRQLFLDEHYARAVEEAFKCLISEVKAKSGLTSEDGASLMRKAFSANIPVLELNTLTTQSEKNEQQGYMDLFAGAVIGIRNPRAHDHQLEDDPDVALEMIVFANHLMRKLDGAAKNP